MIKDDLLMKAVSKIRQRSEKQDDLQKLIGTFVDVGILHQLDNRNSQIFYGRRGTGKTHVLRVLESQLVKENAHNIVAYIDARTLGSTAQFTDLSVSIGERCLALFQDVLGEIYNALIQHIIECPSERAEQALVAADELRKSFLEPTKKYREESLTTSSAEEAKVSKSHGASMSLSADPSPKVAATVSSGGTNEAHSTETVTTSTSVETEEKIIFPALHTWLSSVLDLANSYLYVFFDEWSSLPVDIQPYLAEFLKRGVLPVQRATIKIASLEYRSRFEKPHTGTLIGFEVGADIAVTQDLDDYYVFDRNPEQITTAYADILLRHLNSELSEGYMQSTFGIAGGEQLMSRLFTERNTFRELARASEGVVRDLINIFNIAFFNARRRGRDDIDRRAIVEAARQWFEQDKERQLDEHLRQVLRRIVDDVIGARKARAFLLPRELERHPTVQRLFDARVLHPMQRGYADKDRPGVRYNIYTLDYGTYVDLLGTSKEPQTEMLSQEAAQPTPDFIVPFDDKRSIRRNVLDEKVLS